MSKKATEFQRKAMSKMYRGKEIFKPLNTGWIDENVACVREWVAKVNFDDEPELAMKFRVSSIPMLVLSKNGKIISTSVGYRPKDEILNELKLYMNQE